MIHELRQLFSPFGRLEAAIVKKRLALRGQAFLVFSEVAEAKLALNNMQGAMLFYKPMRIQYATFKSHCHARADGTFAEVTQRQAASQAEKRAKPRLTRRQQSAQRLHATTTAPTALPMPGSSSSAFGPSAPIRVAPQLTPAGELSLPNRILFVQNLPPDFPPADLHALFAKYSGFAEIRTVPTKRDIAFVEFQNESFANSARIALDHFPIQPDHALHVSFAKK